MSAGGLERIAAAVNAGGGGVRTSERFRQLGIREVCKEKDEYLRRAAQRMLTDWELAQLKACDTALDELHALRFLTGGESSAPTARSSMSSDEEVEA